MTDYISKVFISVLAVIGSNFCFYKEQFKGGLEGRVFIVSIESEIEERDTTVKFSKEKWSIIRKRRDVFSI